MADAKLEYKKGEMATQLFLTFDKKGANKLLTDERRPWWVTPSP